MGLYVTDKVQTKKVYNILLKSSKERDDSSDLLVVACGRMVMGGISDKQRVSFGSGLQ
jgi:hypothetical protein